MTEVQSCYQDSDNPDSPKPEDAFKIFVGGLSWDTTQEKLNSYFGQYGEVVDCILMMDPSTKRSRGFGFVTYKDASSVIKALESGPHVLDNKHIDPKAAVPRFPCTNGTKYNNNNCTSPTGSRRCSKIFVGGIGQSTEDDLRSYFQTYGTVTDVTIMMDKTTRRPRGFAFVGFDSSDSSEFTARIRYHTIKGKRVEVKVAQPRDSKCLDFNGSACQYSPPTESVRSETENFATESINNESIVDQSEEPDPDLANNLRLSQSGISEYTRNSIYQLLDDIWK